MLCNWKCIALNFVVRFPHTLGKCDTIWVMVLTKSAHFVQIQTTYNLEKLIKIYIWEIVHFYRMLIFIISLRCIIYISFLEVYEKQLVGYLVGS